MRSKQIFGGYWKRLLSAFLVVFYIWAAATSISAQEQSSQTPSKSCLWSVNSESNVVYLLGSIHLLKPDAYPLAKAIEKAFSNSPKVVFEADIGAMNDPSLQVKMMGLGLYAEGQSLFENIDGSTRQLLAQRMKALGLPEAQFARFKPWLVALTLETLELLKLGFDPAYGVDVHFFSKAKTQKKQIEYLESAEYQLDLLAKMDTQDQNAFLSQTLKDLDLIEELSADLVKYWQNGEADKLYALLFKSLKEHPNVQDRILIQRNKNWVRKIEKMMKEPKNVVVIVGTGHLVGPESVVDMLEKKGYEVKQW